MKNTKCNWIIIAVFALLILALGIAPWATPDKTFSENENRTLQTMPQFTANALLGGTLDDSVESYLADQFWQRDSWTALRSGVKMALQNKDIGGVYLCDDGYYVEVFTQNDLDEARYTKNLGYLRAFFEQCKVQVAPEDITFLLVPTPGYVLQDKLPRYATLFDQDTVFEEIGAAFTDINFLDLRESFREEQKTTQLYYRTDHHWTTAGAFYAYGQWRLSLGETAPDAGDYSVQSYEGFRGTLYSKVLDSRAAIDTIELYRIPGDDALTVEYNGATHTSCYDLEKLQQKNMYEVFLGGNFPTVTIRGGAENGRNLLVIKDSYANSFLPFAASDYESITIIDLRYFLGSMKTVLAENNITDVLVLYSASAFLSDQNMSRLILG